MAIRLTQKKFLKGRREFEIIDDLVEVRIKTLIKSEKLTVSLSILDPDPIQNGIYLEFCSRSRPQPLLSLFLDKPNSEEFNIFIQALKQRIYQAQNNFAEDQFVGLAANVYEEPPEFDDADWGSEREGKQVIKVRVSSVEESIQMLETYLGDEDIQELISALKALKEDPTSETCLQEVTNAFMKLGSLQGAALTYATYLKILITEDPFKDM